MSHSTELERIDKLLDWLEETAESTADLLAFAKLAIDQLADLLGADTVAAYAALSVTAPQKSSNQRNTEHAATASENLSSPSINDPEPPVQWLLLALSGAQPISSEQAWLSDSFCSNPQPNLSATRQFDGSYQFAMGMLGDDRRELTAVITVTIAEPCPPASHAGISALLESVAEILGERICLAQRRVRAEDESLYDHFLSELYANSDASAFDACLAHDLPALLRCQRIAVVRRAARGFRPGKWRLSAISGGSKLGLKTELTTDLQAFVANVAGSHQRPALCIAPANIALQGGRSDAVREKTPPATSQRPDTLLVPLAFATNWSPKTNATNASPADLFLVIQWTSPQVIGGIVPWLPRLLRHLLVAGRQANVLSSRSLLGKSPATTAPRRSLTRLGGWLAGALLAAALVWSTLGIKTDFTIEAKGFLQPLEQRFIFATHDGYVDELMVEDGSAVVAGQVLVRLRSPQLDLQQRGLEGDIAATRKRRDGLVIAISQLDSSRDDTISTSRQLAAEVESLEEKLSSLINQRELIAEQRAQLELRCPIDGTVITWDAVRNLESRPVQRGDSLLKVANLDGPWQLRLWVPDREFSHLQVSGSIPEPASSSTSGDEAAGPLQVTFKMLSRPEEEYRGTLQSIGNTVQTPATLGPAIAVDFALQSEQIEGLQVGATATGRIHCGRRVWWYVWTRTLQESLQRRFWISGETSNDV